MEVVEKSKQFYSSHQYLEKKISIREIKTFFDKVNHFKNTNFCHLFLYLKEFPKISKKIKNIQKYFNKF